MRHLAFIIWLVVFSLGTSFAKKPSEEKELRNDLKIIWPLIQIVKVEYELVNAQLEFYQTKDAKNEFLENYEDFVKKKYFDEVKTLNLRQGKLLLLLIDRELSKTPYDLLWEYRSFKRAHFWQRCSRLIGASLRTKYTPEDFPEIEKQLQLIRDSNPLMYPNKSIASYER